MPNSVIKPIICMVSLLAMIGVTPAMAIEDIHLHVPQAKKVGKARMMRVGSVISP